MQKILMLCKKKSLFLFELFIAISDFVWTRNFHEFLKLDNGGFDKSRLWGLFGGALNSDLYLDRSSLSSLIETRTKWA